MTDITALEPCFSWTEREPPARGDSALDQHSLMNGFLQDVERRALRMAELAVGNREDALELVQEAMLGLVRRYASRPDSEWKPLFYRILRSRINDLHRRRAVRRRVMALVPGGDAGEDPIEQASYGERDNPVEAMQQDLNHQAMLTAIGELPLRQQQAFVLRAWEGLSVRDTAIAMACSEGSVKTHYNRAIKGLRQALKTLNPHEHD